MGKYKEITVNGETYRQINGKWVDSTYLVPPMDVLREILKSEVNLHSIEECTMDELIDSFNKLRNYELIGEAEAVAQELYERFSACRDIDRLRWILPIRTSMLRSLDQSRSAIELYRCALDNYGKDIDSAPLLTSVAAAYCDVSDYDTAKQFAGKALALGGYTLELTKVYARINKALQ